MATTGGSAEPTFVDTNVLIQAAITTAPLHVEAVARLAALDGTGAELWISRQVLREYLAVLSRPQAYTAALSPTELVADVTRFQAQCRSDFARFGSFITVEPLVTGP